MTIAVNIPQVAAVGHNLWVGDMEACNAACGEPATQGTGPVVKYERILHIYRDDHFPAHACSFARRLLSNDTNLVVEYKDGRPLGTLSVPFTDIMKFLREYVPTLIHCAAGQTRSSTLAVAAKIARGCRPDQAITDVILGLWKDRGIAANITADPLNDILHWAVPRA